MPRPPVVVRESDVAIDGWPDELSGVRIAHISDLHLRRWNETLRHAQRILAGARYDLLFVSGDFGTLRRYWKTAIELTKRFFDPLAERSAIHAILGNHDDPRIAEADLPLIFLRNQSICVDVQGVIVNVSGIEQAGRTGGDLEATLGTARSDSPTILMAHYPSTVFRLTPDRVQLVLSGHTHGGQIRLPGVGCIWPNDRVPRRMASGLHRVAGIWLNVSAGIGASLPVPVRINCPPEISVLTLVRTHPVRAARSGGLKTRKIRRTVPTNV